MFKFAAEHIFSLLLTMMNTDKHWEQWGRTNPYYGVLSDDRFRGKSLSENVYDDFFKSGEEYISAVIQTASGLCDDFSPRRVLDFGCGVGRLLVPLAERFDQIVGVDVSPSMLAEAQKNVARFDGRVILAQSDDELTQVQGTFDLIHSVIVFQHIPRGRGMNIVARLLSRLNQGGMAVLHFPYSRNASAISKKLHLARRVIPGVHPILNAIRGRPLSDPIMEMNCYDIGNILSMYRKYGSEDVHIRVHPEHTGYCTATLYGVNCSSNVET